MPRYDEEDARAAIAASRSYTEALRRLGMTPRGGNHRVFRRWVDEIWRIPTDHFDPWAAPREALARSRAGLGLNLEDILVEGSTYQRHGLKRRLYAAGLKLTVCELCGQDEMWCGRAMAMILDHINGVPDDHRLENLRIVCPNCAATLDTHCGRKNRSAPALASCDRCGREFAVRRPGHRYCSRECGTRRPRPPRPIPERRKVPRPPYEQLLAEIAAEGYSAVGRRYGVSDNAIRKWVRQYERERDGQADSHGGASGG